MKISAHFFRGVRPNEHTLKQPAPSSISLGNAKALDVIYLATECFGCRLVRGKPLFAEIGV